MTRSFTHARHASPVGPLHIVADGERLAALDFAEYEPRMMKLLKRRFGEITLVPGATPAPIAAALEAYFAGGFDALDGIELEMGGTAFQRSVWQALRAIPAGETRSYGGLATALAKPSASRAVGLANGSNPIGIVVPCHRVIGASGALTGYAGGLARKRFLLELENAAFRH